MHRRKSSLLVHLSNLLLLIGFTYAIWTAQWMMDGTFAALAQERPSNPAERGEPTKSNRAHPERPKGPEKPADAELPAATTKTSPDSSQGPEERRWDWLPEGFAAWMLIPIAGIVLAIIFMSLSTSPSRDPSRKPR